MKFRLNEIVCEGQPEVSFHWRGISIEQLLLTDLEEEKFLIDVVQAYEAKHGKEKTQEVILGME